MSHLCQDRIRHETFRGDILSESFCSGQVRGTLHTLSTCQRIRAVTARQKDRGGGERREEGGRKGGGGGVGGGGRKEEGGEEGGGRGRGGGEGGGGGERVAELKLLKSARFGDTRTTAGSLRSDANVIAVTGIEADYDGEFMSVDDAIALLQKQGIAAIVDSRQRIPRPRRDGV